jgi:hypothetical protein
MTGQTHERWVSGFDVETNEPKGRLRTDANALRFIEVTINGPKTWSLASAMHPDISTASDAAQDRAEQVVDWVAQHATTRVGPRDRQLQIPAEPIEAAVIQHYTPRGPAIRADTSTCRSTPGCSLPEPGGESTPWASGTASKRSTASATPPSQAILSSAWPSGRREPRGRTGSVD